MWRKSPAGSTKPTATDASIRPPRFAVWLLCRFLPAEDRDCLLGDLTEEFRDVQVPRRGRSIARCWYWAQAIRSVAGKIVAGGRRPATGESAPKRPTAASLTTDRPGDGLMNNVIRDVRYGLRTLL